MTIFEKGNYKPVPADYRNSGLMSLEELSRFQHKYNSFDTDTTINSIRDAVVANYLGFELLNFEKHGFDAKKLDKEQYLEVKQCSFSTSSWGGTWNDTNKEKAIAFSDERLFTVVAVWRGASDLQFMVYGQHVGLGEHLLRLVTNRKAESRSTQSISIQKLIKDYGFVVVCPPDKTKENIIKLLVNYNRTLANYININNVKEIQDI